MTLQDEIAAAQSYATDPPKNESNTCEWIILPLLWSAGYARRDIDSRAADNGGQFPDYTLLTNDAAATWYLEAKAWNVALEDNHARQALNYANHNGKRFVVLTNGQTWRFYDNSIQGVLADKLITDASLLNTPEITEFLNVLSKTNALSGGLGRFAVEVIERQKQDALELQMRRQQEEEMQRILQRQNEIKTVLHSTLAADLSDPDSELLHFIAQYLQGTDELRDMAPETLACWFAEVLSRSPADLASESVTPALSDVPAPMRHEGHGERILSFKALQGIPIDGKNIKPVLLYLPDGTKNVVRSWVDFAVEAVRWLLQQTQPLPIPFEASNRSRWFLNNTADHKRPGQRTKFKTISANGQTVYMDSDRSGQMFLGDIYMLCLTMKVAPDGFRVVLTG